MRRTTGALADFYCTSTLSNERPQGDGRLEKGEAMELQIRPYQADDIKAMVRIWNEVVEAGDAFPQVTPLTEQNADEFFSAQTATMVADVNGIIFGMYILHPNNIGRCAHIANASFAVASASRGLGLGRKLVENCIETCGKKGFRGLQFNAVVTSNVSAQHLYESIGFTKVGKIPGGFINGLGGYEDIFIYYIDTLDASQPC